MQKCKLAPFNLANGCIRWIKNINIKSFLGNGTKLHSVQLLIHSPPGCQISSKSPNRTIFGVVMMICRFSRWRPLRRTFTSGFGLGADPLFRMSVSISKTKFCRNISIRGWDIAIHGLKKNKRPPYWNFTSGSNLDHTWSSSKVRNCCGLSEENSFWTGLRSLSNKLRQISTSTQFQLKICLNLAC